MRGIIGSYAGILNKAHVFYIIFFSDLVLRTYTNDVNYAKVYDVEILCVETGTDPMNITSANMKNIDIIFREHLTSCPTVMSSIVMQNANLSQGLKTPSEKNTKSFFDDTKNVAALSSIGGVAAGGAIGAGVYFMTKKQCSTK